jgi:ankyrin repeat protein
LSHGASIDAVDDRGRSALMTAAELGHAEVVGILLGHGADATLRDKTGKTALDLAANDGVRQALAGR